MLYIGAAHNVYIADLSINTRIEVRLLREVELLGYQYYLVNTQNVHKNVQKRKTFLHEEGFDGVELKGFEPLTSTMPL